MTAPAASLANIFAAYREIAPSPGPDAHVGDVGRYLAVQAVRRRTLSAASPGLATQDQVDVQNFAFGALHALRTLSFVCDIPDCATQGRAANTALEMALAWRHGDYDSWLDVHCEALGLDMGEIVGLAKAEAAMRAATADGDGRTAPGAGGETPEAEIAALRAQVEHLSAALAGDNEGVRLWMLDCGQLTAGHRERASVLASKLRKADETLAAIEHKCRTDAMVIIPGDPDPVVGVVAVADILDILTGDGEPVPHCGARWPNLGPAGGLRTCSLDRGHDGDHEAHVAEGRRANDRSAVIPQGHPDIITGDGGPVEAPETLAAYKQRAGGLFAPLKAEVAKLRAQVTDADGFLALNDGEPARWSSAPAPGGYVCAVPAPGSPDGICGHPVESEPCPEHRDPEWRPE